jgi:hypothetical protein
MGSQRRMKTAGRLAKKIEHRDWRLENRDLRLETGYWK